MRWRAVWPGVAGALLLAVSAAGHTRSVSYSSWHLDDTGARVRVRVPLLELSRLDFDPVIDVGSGGRAARYLADRLTLSVGGEPCKPPEPPVALSAPEGWAYFQWRVDCKTSGPATITSRILLEQAPSHMHFARIEQAGQGVLERVLTEGEPSWKLAAPDASGKVRTTGTSLVGYIVLGVKHILSGWDHLAFVLALLLLANGLREVAGLVTSFTLAHSVTLGLAVLGIVRPDAGAVEALIGFSIALVAAENAWLLAGRGRLVPCVATGALLLLGVLSIFRIGGVPAATLAGLALFTACHFALLDRVERPARLRAAVAFAFGLVHGFGFAGVLAEMQLPVDRLAPALFGFNVGVEIGQLSIVCAVWPVLGWLERRSPLIWRRRVAELGSASILAVGLFWFLERTFG